MPHLPGTGAIYGVVAEDGTPKASSPVKLYDRSTGQLLRSAQTEVDGSFKFTGLNPLTDDYQVLATDEDGGPSYKNAEIVDRITPTSMAQGTQWREGWYKTISKLGFHYVWPAPAYDNRYSHVPALNSGGTPCFAWALTGQCQFNQTSMIANAPELASVTVGNGAATGILVGGRGTPYITPLSTYVGHATTQVFVVDFSVSAGWLLGFLRHTDQAPLVISSPQLRVSFNFANKVLAVFGSATTANNTTPTYPGELVGSSNEETPNGTQIASVTLSEPPTGVAMVTVVFVPGTFVKIYIDKTLQLNSSTNIPTLQVNVALTTGGFLFTGYSATEPYPAATGPRLGFYARACRVITDSEVNDIHDSLFSVSETAVTESGIRRVITSLYPECYYPLDSLAGNVCDDYIRASGTIAYSELSVTPQLQLQGSGASLTTSPVVGGAAVNLAQTACWVSATSVAAGVLDNQASFVFHLRMNGTDTGVIAKLVATNALTTAAGFTIEVVTGNKITFTVTGESGIAFQTALTNSVDYIVGIVLDKTSATATVKLYLDGILVETINITTTTTPYTAYRKLLRIGADYNDTTVSNGLNAVISQFAKFNYALNAAQMLSIYESVAIP